MSSDELKAKGNAAFSEQRFQDAIDFFSQAIAIDPRNHVLYSNKSAAEASLGDYDSALESAKKCVEIKPDWGKGYSRLGAAYHGLQQYDEAVSAYQEGLKLDPNSEVLKSGLQEAEDAKASQAAPKSPGVGMFSNPEVLTRLAMDPRTRPLLGQPAFMAMLRDCQSSPSNMTKYIQNPQFQLLLEVALGLKVGTAGEGEEDGSESQSNGHATAKSSEALKTSFPPPPKDEPTPTPMEEDLPSDAKEQAAKKAEAIKEKEKGNEAYKAKRFEEAISHYNRALELYDEDISFLTNRAAVYFETGQYDQCIADCDKAVERGRELRADFKLVAKAMARKGSALVKQDKLEDAIAMFNKSLTEHRVADTLKKLNDAEKLLKDRKEQAYIDVDKCNEEREKGNTAFKEQRYPEAVVAYQEALKRGPPQVNPEAYKLYSNLAACYTKLGAYPEGVKAADKCIELAPTFAKGYSRKGTLQYFMKEYDKAMETYRKGLAVEPDNEELMEGAQRCVDAIARFASGEATESEIKERQARSMADPEVQNILKDPVMQQVLKDFQENPRDAQKHLKAPEIMAKINKLVAAGIIQVK